LAWLSKGTESCSTANRLSTFLIVVPILSPCWADRFLTSLVLRESKGKTLPESHLAGAFLFDPSITH